MRARFALLGCWFVAALTAMAAAAERPNVIYILADDLGYGDLACYGSRQAQTPRLDRLAAEGTRFTQFYVNCVCSPTRAAAITGHFPSRHGIHAYLSQLANNRKRQMPHWLDANCPSLPRALQQAGYRTAMIGKWHLGGGSGSRNASGEIYVNHPDAPPVAHYGFDHVRTTFGNSPTWREAEPQPQPHDLYPYADGPWATWSSRAIADETIEFLRDHARRPAQQPFYINVWLKDVHVPLRPTEQMLEPFADLEEKPRVHYAMVRYMDQQIGRILDALDELSLRDNTLVLFSSDNGAGKNRGGSSGPLREWKHFNYEGGIRSPFIARWPGRVPGGGVDEQAVLNVVDLIPTVCRLSGAAMPSGYQSDGEDITAALFGKPFRRTKPQFWYYPSAQAGSPQLAIRSGDWKLLTDPDGKRQELYNLRNDPAESRNLAGSQPERAKELQQQLLAWYGELHVGRHTAQ